MNLGQVIIIFISYAIIQSIALVYKLITYKKKTHRFFVFPIALLVLISIIGLDHLYMFFDWYKEIPLMLWWIVPFWFLISPLFLHTIKFFFLGYRFRLIELIHYVPFFVIAWRYKAGFITPEDLKLEYYIEIMSEGFEPSEPHFLLLSQLFLYAIWSFILIRKTIASKKQTESNSVYEDYITSERLVLFYTFFVISLGVGLFLMRGTDATTVMKYNGLELLFISSIVILLSSWLIKNRNYLPNNIHFSPNDTNNQKYYTSSLSERDLKEIIKKLNDHITSKELFKNCDLRIHDVSKETGIKSHYISQAINQIVKKNFFDFINDFRVNAVKSSIKENTELEHYSLVGLSSIYGFKSASSFYRIFKKHTGVTPGQYKDIHYKK